MTTNRIYQSQNHTKTSDAGNLKRKLKTTVLTVF
jgi:hypothetical protein